MNKTATWQRWKEVEAIEKDEIMKKIYSNIKNDKQACELYKQLMFFIRETSEQNIPMKAMREFGICKGIGQAMYTLGYIDHEGFECINDMAFEMFKIAMDNIMDSTQKDTLA